MTALPCLACMLPVVVQGLWDRYLLKVGLAYVAARPPPGLQCEIGQRLLTRGASTNPEGAYRVACSPNCTFNVLPVLPVKAIIMYTIKLHSSLLFILCSQNSIKFGQISCLLSTDFVISIFLRSYLWPKISMSLDCCKNILVLICPVFYGLNVCPGWKAFMTGYLFLGCDIALCGVSVLYCDMQVMYVGFISVV